MFSLIEKSGTGIGKSGSGIEKSGTGIEKSGTGIEKSGTGLGRGRWQVMSLVASVLFAAQGLAADPEVLVTSGNDQVFVSVHSGDGILVGRAATLDQSGYYQLALYPAVGPAGSDAVFQPLVAGSGSGSSGEKCPGGASTMVAGSGSGNSGEGCQPGASVMVAGSGSGSSTEVAGSGSGSSKEVAGSGSGDAGEDCQSGGARLMVAGSGSGSEGEGCGAQVLVAGSGSGSSGEACATGAWLDVAGSGSGSSGEESGCAYPMNAWGIAEVVVDRSGAHVVIHQIKGSQAEEYLVAFLPVSNSEVAHSLYRGSSNHGFVAAP